MIGKTNAQINAVKGVKGNNENNFRKGEINLTPANIGVPTRYGGMGYSGDNDATFYGTCSVNANVAEKTVTKAGFNLVAGAWIAVKFANTNTAATSGLKLNVNSTGAKPIKYKNADLLEAGQLEANRIYLFVYDGTNYQMIGDPVPRWTLAFDDDGHLFIDA